MAKILISLLGTANLAKGDNAIPEYSKTDYLIDNVLYEDERFVSSAIIKHHAIQKVYFIGTAQSMWHNVCINFYGDDNYALELLQFKEENKIQESDLTRLGEILDMALSDTGSKCFLVEDAEDEDGIWRMFEKFQIILEQLNPKDEVYFDITHLFRSVSVMSFVMAEFAKTHLEYRLSGMFYGLYKKDEPSKVIDLRVLFELLDWARAIHNLKKYGNGWELKKLISKSEFGKDIQNSFSDFSDALSISDIGSLQNSLTKLKTKIEHFKSHDNRILGIVSKELQAFIKRFEIKQLHLFQLELAKWYAQNVNYAFAYITIVEAIVSAVCYRHSLDPTNKSDRSQAKDILNKDYKFGLESQQKIYKAYIKTNAIRVNIAHKLPQDSVYSKSQPKQSIENFNRYLSELMPLFK